MDITKIDPTKYLSNPPWDWGNDILYDICQKHPYHTEDHKILAKVLFIGRIYAAAIERRRTNEKSIQDAGCLESERKINDDFYTEIVVPNLKGIDRFLNGLEGLKLVKENIPHLLEVHNKLILLISGFTCLNKRSFVSKYLHFHYPHLFFIFDSRAVGVLNKMSKEPCLSDFKIPRNVSGDEAYANFFYRCYFLRAHFEKQNGVELTPRQIDNIFLHYANELARSKSQS